MKALELFPLLPLLSSGKWEQYLTYAFKSTVQMLKEILLLARRLGTALPKVTRNCLPQIHRAEPEL